MAYDVSNPHPLFGKDPNIINELGHTRYPRWVDHPSEKLSEGSKFPKRVLVQNPKEEEELTGKKPKGSKSWGDDKKPAEYGS